MSQTITQTQQLQLVNIISISEIKLANNFTVLSRRLNKNDSMFQKCFSEIETNRGISLNRINQVQTNLNSDLSKIKEQINQIFNDIYSLKQSKVKQEERIKKSQSAHQKLNDQIFNTQLQFQQKISIQLNMHNEVMQNIRNIQSQLQKINNQVSTKQNKNQVQKISKEIQQLKQKNIHLQNQLKLNEHKIQKIQIFNQKNQRIQAKKDVQILKQIEQKIKREVKATLKGINVSVVNSIPSSTQLSKNTSGAKPLSSNPNSPPTPISNSPDKQNLLNIGVVQQQRRPSLRKRLPFNMQQDQLLSEMMKNNIDSPLSKLNERLNKIQAQQKDFGQLIKLNRIKKDDKTGDNGVKDKINQLKPEVIKLWAKFDTLEDRLAFNQKKTEEKSKILNDLVTLQKQNNWQKMEEKIKNLQTQIYANIKDIRAKLDTKVNITDYDKFVMTNDDKIRQINELIYLKSDKLQVKKALLFLESKIKQIILVISQDQQNQKDALLTKKPLKCISCDKQVDKFSGTVSANKGNWDGMPYKDHAPETLGKFGMTSFGSLSKKLKKLESKDLPLLNKKKNNDSSGNNGSNSP